MGKMGAVLVLTVVVSTAAEHIDEDVGEYTISQIMQRSHKTPLYKRVVRGESTRDEEFLLYKLYAELRVRQPPQGSRESWEHRTTQLQDAAEAVIYRKPGARGQLRRAASCIDCHKVHR